MLGLDALRTRHALGLAASMSSGLVGNFGSMTKPLQVGWAAQNGILAGRLAHQGVTAAADAIEGPRGLLVALSPAGRPRLDGPPEVGSRWRIESSGLNIKRYPICYAMHRATDAALQLREQLAGATPDHIAVRLGRQQAGMLRPGIPASALDAKFSVPFAMACAFARGHVGLADLTDEATQDPVLQNLMARVEVLVWDAVDPTEPLFSPHDEVLVTLADGLQLRSEPVTRALGHASRPLDDHALRAKFLDCASVTMSSEQAQVAWDALTKED
jgi:2-methylcitrate dehydratase PrpD